VYDWAGRTRTINISLPGSTFGHWTYIDDDLGDVLRRLSSVDQRLVGLPRKAFIERLAFYYGEINARHPFREGNGRTQRSFLRQLSASAGYVVNWTQVAQEANIEACRANLATGDTQPLIDMLEPVVTALPAMPDLPVGR
jgi:cell filamentation protein